MALPLLRIPGTCCSIPFTTTTKPQLFPSKTLRKTTVAATTELQTPLEVPDAKDYQYPSGNVPTHKVKVHDRVRGIVHEFLVPEV
ncbi:ferredoxin c2 [Trifolium pratense]|uniref:Ferredoxin c2 n=1 Tax=Trifolium pratense TaxID=57577 RepID=A0A2K3KC59_TRIPR|nr:ferredoxin c2 [Trifolium pratense]